jgi:hypothetical protein
MCNQFLGPMGINDLCSRFDFFGGVPRHVFHANQEDMRAEVEEALAKSEIMRNLKFLGEQDCFLDEHSHLLLVVNALGFKNYQLDFISTQIADRMTQHYIVSLPYELLHFVQATADKPIIAGVRGVIFEKLAHAFLCRGGKFRMRQLFPQVGEETEIEMDKRVCCWYGVDHETIVYEREDIGADPYSRPRSKTEAGFDTFDNQRFFLMTVSRQKKIKLGNFQKNLNPASLQGDTPKTHLCCTCRRIS